MNEREQSLILNFKFKLKSLILAQNKRWRRA